MSLLLVRLVISHILVPTLEQSSLLGQSEGKSDAEKHPAIVCILRTLGVYDREDKKAN